MSRLALATPLLPFVTCCCCFAIALLSRMPARSGWSDVAERAVLLAPLPLAAVGVSLVAVIRIARRPHDLKGLPHALLGLALNLGVLVVALTFVWFASLS